MHKKIAVISDIHGNLEALESIMLDISKQNIDDIICLGDTISLGPDSKECIDILINNKVKMILGNHELYILRGTDIVPNMEKDEKEHYDWVKRSLTDKELSFMKNCPLYYEYTIKYDDKIDEYKIIFSHYLINDINDNNPFENTRLDKDINLWIKYNNEREEHIIGHLHKSFDENIVGGISGDYIIDTGELANIMVVDSAGCTNDNKTSYLLIDIEKSIEQRKITLLYDRKKFVDKLLNTNFPDKKNILKCFFGIEI